MPIADAVHNAQKAIKCHPDFDQLDKQTLLVDLLADLRHWADAHHVDMYYCLDRSYDHYVAERAEETPVTQEG